MNTNKVTCTGRFKIRKFRAGTQELLWESPWIKNLVVESATTGTGILALASVGLYNSTITRAGIGTGDTAPADANTDLETAVLTDVTPTYRSTTLNVAFLEFFMSDAELANGTYREFALFCGDSWANRKLYARALISPTYTKSTGEDTQINYQLTFNN